MRAGEEEGRAAAVGPGADDGAVAVGEERVCEGDGRVEVLADEEVAVVEGCGVEADEELAGAGGGEGDVGELEAGGG